VTDTRTDRGRYLTQRETIRSAANPFIKRIRSLQRRRTRYQERAFVVEGFRAVEDVIAAGATVELVLLREDVVTADVTGFLDAHAIGWRVIDARLFDDLTDVGHPQGVLAIVEMLEQPSLADIANLGHAPLYLILDGVKDPGNLGTLFRSAAGAGVDFVLLTPETVDPYNPKAVRAAMGAHVRVPFAQVDANSLRDVLSSARIVGLAEANGDADYDAVDWTEPSAIVVGGEAFGPSLLAREQATVTVRIPLSGEVESLNAAVAGSLLVFEASRQRRLAKRRES
jgi:TrmH family RNA methyltransferase